MNELIRFDNLSMVLEAYAERVIQVYQNNLLDNDHIATWELIHSIKYEVEQGDRRFIVSLNLQEYWKYVEWDTKPHFPPVDALLKWIEIKPVLPRPMANGKLPTPRQLAYLIGRKISEEGTQGTHDLTDALKQVNDEYLDLIMEAIDADLCNAVDNVLLTLYK